MEIGSPGKQAPTQGVEAGGIELGVYLGVEDGVENSV
jgi:hypothetical protein